MLSINIYFFLIITICHYLSNICTTNIVLVFKLKNLNVILNIILNIYII